MHSVLPCILLAATSWWDMTPEVIREKIDARIMSIAAPQPKVLKVEDATQQNVPVRIYTPCEQRSACALLFIHGGAFVAGSLDTHDNLARYLASKTNCEVISVGYTLAPDAKYPLALEQCYSVLEWLSKRCSSFIVVGDSAGGNLAASLTLLSRDRNGPKPLAQILINPATDLTIDCANMPWQAAQYLSKPEEAKLPYASPIYAKDLSNLPQALIILSELDELKPSGEAYANHLKAADVTTKVYCQPNTGHLAGDAARASPVAEPSLEVVVSTINELLKQPSKNAD